MVLHALITYCRGGHCGLFGKGGLIMFDLGSRQVTYTVTDLAVVMLLGVLGGLLGALFNFLVDRVLRVYSLVNA
jgi:chloride channel 7